jgi:hypothetical protein
MSNVTAMIRMAAALRDRHLQQRSNGSPGH